MRAACWFSALNRGGGCGAIGVPHAIRSSLSARHRCASCQTLRFRPSRAVNPPPQQTQGYDYTDMLFLVNFAYDVPVGFQEGKGTIGGFTMRTINTARLCLTTVNAACLKIKGPDVSVMICGVDFLFSALFCLDWWVERKGARAL